jgi:cobalt-zinc-cadmium efflux system membrane fusion protein
MTKMTRNKLIIAAAAGVLVVGAAGVLLGQTVFDPHSSKSSAGAEEAGEHAEEGHGGAEGVEMSADQVKASGIEVAAAQAGAMSGGIETQGSIAAAPDGLAVLSARSPGSVASISKRLGDPVARGEVLARIESGEGAGLAAALASAESRAQLARSTFEREKRLFEAKITARQDFETAQQALTVAEAELSSAKTAMSAAGVCWRFERWPVRTRAFSNIGPDHQCARHAGRLRRGECRAVPRSRSNQSPRRDGFDSCRCSSG